jgi:hypothetical protein
MVETDKQTMEPNNKEDEVESTPVEVISELLYKSYKESIVKPIEGGAISFNKYKDFVVVEGNDNINKRIYFNYISKIDDMKIHHVKVSIFTNGKTKTKMIGKTHIEITSDSIRIIDRYQASEDTLWYEDEATQLLYTNVLKDYTSKKLKEFKYEDIKELVEQVVYTINNLTFDKFSGLFVLKSEKETRKNVIDAYKTIFKSESITLNIGECVVCMDDTKTKTHCCGKNLCRFCWDKLKPKNIDVCGYPDSELPCPNCRKDLRYDRNNC